MKSPSPAGRVPVRWLDVRMETSAYDQFVGQMREFGASFGFKVLIKPSSPRPYDTLFQMLRPDIDLVAGKDPEPRVTDLRFGIGFYPKRDQPAPPAEDVAPLVEGLRQFLNQVPGASITEVTARQ